MSEQVKAVLSFIRWIIADAGTISSVAGMLSAMFVKWVTIAHGVPKDKAVAWIRGDKHLEIDAEVDAEIERLYAKKLGNRRSTR